jgi:hypothetical protein
LSHGIRSYICMYTNAVAGSVMLYLQHDFYSIKPLIFICQRSLSDGISFKRKLKNLYTKTVIAVFFRTVTWCKTFTCRLEMSYPSYNEELTGLVSHGATIPPGQGPPPYRGFTITLRHTTLGRIPLDEWSARQRPLPDNTQQSQETDLRARARNSNPQCQQTCGRRPTP